VWEGDQPEERHARLPQALLLLFPVVLVRDDSDPGGKRRQSVHVIAIAVRQDNRGNRLWRDLRNVLEQFLAARRVVFASMTMMPLSPMITPLFPPPPSIQ
jgi:hypothetical protein